MSKRTTRKDKDKEDAMDETLTYSISDGDFMIVRFPDDDKYIKIVINKGTYKEERIERLIDPSDLNIEYFAIAKKRYQEVIPQQQSQSVVFGENKQQTTQTNTSTNPNFGFRLN